LEQRPFRQHVVNLLIEWWQHATLENDNELRIGNILGEKSRKGLDGKRRSGCGSLSICINLDSDKFLYMKDFANPLIFSRSPLVTLLKALAGLRGISEFNLGDAHSLAWKTSSLCMELDQVLNSLLFKSIDCPPVKQTPIPKANVKFIPASQVDYPYFNQDGSLIMAVVREENAQGLKRIRRERPGNKRLAANDIPLYNTKNIPRPSVEIIIFVEGEKCVEAIQPLLPHNSPVWVTTLAGGAGSRLKVSHLKLLNELKAKIVWVSDLSETGFKYAFDNYDILKKENITTTLLSEVELLNFYGFHEAPEKDYDIADHLKSISKPDQFQIVSDLINLCEHSFINDITYNGLFKSVAEKRLNLSIIQEPSNRNATSHKKSKRKKLTPELFPTNTTDLSTTGATIVKIFFAEQADDAFKGLLKFPYCGLDIETTGLHSTNDRISLVQVYNHEANVCYIFDLISNRQELNNGNFKSKDVIYNVGLLEALSNKLKQTKNYFFISANAGFESAFIFNQLNVTLKILCVQVLESFVVTNKTATRDLAFLVNKYFELTLSKELQTSNWYLPLSEAQYEYAALDAVYATKIFEKQKSSLCVGQLEGKMWEGYLSICNCLRTYKLIEERGVNFDRGKFDEWVRARNLQCEELEQRLLEEIQPSNKKLTASVIVSWMEKEHSELLPYFDITSKSQKVSVSRESIAKFERECHLPLPDVLNKWLLLEKIKGQLSDFAHPIIKNIERYGDGKLHTNYFVGRQITGRVSATEFALNLLPKKNAKGIELRNLVIPSPGNKLLVIDIAQQESLFFALIVNAREQLNRMRQNLDMHAYAASGIYGCDITQVTKEQRRFGKLANLALSYGMGAKKFQSKLSLEDERNVTLFEASHIRDGWHRAFSELSEAQKSQFKLATDRGYAESKRGRRRTWKGKVGYSESINFPVQATAADFLYLLIEKLIDNNIDPYLIGTAHDEIILDIPESKVKFITESVQKIIKDCMVQLFPEEDVTLWEQLTLTEVKAVDSWSGQVGMSVEPLQINQCKSSKKQTEFKLELKKGSAIVLEALLPEGLYEAEIIEVMTNQISSNGNPMAIVNIAVFVPVENESELKVVIIRDWWVWNKTGGIMSRTIQKLWDILPNTRLSQESMQLIGKQVTVQLRQDNSNGEMVNSIIRYFDADN